MASHGIARGRAPPNRAGRRRTAETLRGAAEIAGRLLEFREAEKFSGDPDSRVILTTHRTCPGLGREDGLQTQVPTCPKGGRDTNSSPKSETHRSPLSRFPLRKRNRRPPRDDTQRKIFIGTKQSSRLRERPGHGTRSVIEDAAGFHPYGNSEQSSRKILNSGF